MEPIKCFLIERTNKQKRFLRRLSRFDSSDVCLNGRSHEAMNFLDTYEVPTVDENDVINDDWDKSDDRWPVKCEACDYIFADNDMYQVFKRRFYKNVETGDLYTLEEAPVGAMWYADWYNPIWKGPDGRALVVKLPGNHDWLIDSRCSNCTRPDDKIHKCWVRHGVPPTITVDKNGDTCNAGAGSIQVPGFHGFLKGGYIVDV